MNRGEFTSEIMDFIWYLKEHKNGSRILDCGAGGRFPKMYLLHQHGFQPEGIEIDESSMKMAEDFYKEKNIPINIKIGDICVLPYDNNSFDGVYSYNTIFHMSKVQIKVAMNEMIRVLKPGGLGFVNFIGHEDSLVSMGEERLPGEIVEIMDGEEVIHTVLTPLEGFSMLEGMTILENHNKKILRNTFDPPYTYHLMDYFFQKPL